MACELPLEKIIGMQWHKTTIVHDRNNKGYVSSLIWHATKNDGRVSRPITKTNPDYCRLHQQGECRAIIDVKHRP